MNKEKVTAAKEKCLRGDVLSKDEIVELLEIPLGSEDDKFLRKCAREAAGVITGDRGYIWCAVGMDFKTCEMNCRFCSFGEKWGIVREERIVTEEEVLESIRHYAEDGADYIVLRTTEFYSVDRLIEYAKLIRKEIPGEYRFVLNTGELDRTTADRVSDAGVYGMYHALRLREGEDTPFDPEVRLETMKSIRDSRLELISLTEPIGPEHSYEEIAERFLTTVEYRASIGGAMARFPVEGTPFENTRRLTDDEIAHIIAVLRLSGGDVIKDICVHPASYEALSAGANVMVVESGAIPRDNCFCRGDFRDADMAKSHTLMRRCGYLTEKRR